MNDIVDTLFEDPATFSRDWKENEVDVIAAVELINIALFASKHARNISNPEIGRGNLWSDIPCKLRNWNTFTESVARVSLKALASSPILDSRDIFLQSISSIEVLKYLFFIFVLFF